jgi:hypothetical protein
VPNPPEVETPGALLEPEPIEEGPRRSSRVWSPTKSYVPSFRGKSYKMNLVNVSDFNHAFVNVPVTDNPAWATVTHYTMLQLSMNNNNSMISSVRTTALSAFEAPNFKAWSRLRPQDQVALLM